MKTRIKITSALVGSLVLILVGRATAQTLTVLHIFTPLTSNTNSDGAVPYASLILSGNTLYGTTYAGGSSGKGTVFAVNTDSTGFTNLYNFTGGSDGANPYAGLVLSGSTLYGTAYRGGSSGYGTVFAIATNGMGFTNLYSFTARSGANLTNTDGANPRAGLILSGNTLYGTACWGGRSSYGTVFAINTDGTSFTNLHNFTDSSDGANPYPGLVLSGNTLYGTASIGGSAQNGTVFKVNTDGTGFTLLHSFTALVGPNLTNSDGVNPYAGLVLSGNTLYGLASQGGSSGRGTVFAVSTNGATSFTNLYNFTALNNNTNSDGVGPVGLILSGNTLYGTANGGGSLGVGTIFALTTNGGFTNLHSFIGSDGGSPWAGLILSRNTLYGTASIGGPLIGQDRGVVFSLSLPLPMLAINLSGTNAILTWPANAPAFNLQSAPVIAGTFANVPGATSPYTNPVSSTQKFYRLSQ